MIFRNYFSETHICINPHVNFEGRLYFVKNDTMVSQTCRNFYIGLLKERNQNLSLENTRKLDEGFNFSGDETFFKILFHVKISRNHWILL